jgi:hypothetical protein|tara:strand:- start:673 stop:1005 length:333 start_codon:yes stop_codon:yes gene_type:complete
MLGDAAVSKFIRGPISLNQILEFSKYGVNAVRILMYIRMQEGILVSRSLLPKNEHTFIKIPNKTLESMFGVHRSIKWEKLRTLEENGLIELKINGQGIAPEAKIIVPRLH